MSDAAWSQSLERHKQRLGAEAYDAIVEILDYDTFSSGFTKLVSSYSSRRSTACLQKLGRVFDIIQTFTLVIGTMVQSNPAVAALVWGSVLAIVELAKPVLKTFEKITNVLSDITASLPRFKRYMQLFPESEELKTKARSLYDTYVDFLIDARTFLLRNSMINWVFSLWPSSRFAIAEERVKQLTKGFEDEVQLSTREATVAGVRKLLDNTSSMPAPTSQKTTVTLPRNDKFFGQASRLKELHAAVGPQAAQPAKSQQQDGQPPSRQRSCCLHGIGGSGKTSIALEYIYRHQNCFNHFFWVNSEHAPELAASYALIAKEVLPECSDKSMDQEKLIRHAKQWLSSTTDSWLLVFDNVVKSDMIQPLIPCSTQGSIIITTQAAEIQDMTTSSINLQGLSSDQEGVDMLMHYLQNKKVAREDVKAVIDLIGEIPLAIAHTAGVINQTDCSLKEFINIIKDRSQRGTIWSGDKPSTILHYERSFAAVFDVALETLSAGVREILECLAFLDPNGIPEEMIFPHVFEVLNVDRNLGEFEIKKQLKSRHLVERRTADSSPASGKQPSAASVDTSPAFLVHRTVQQVLLFQLDETPAKRQQRFTQAFQLLRIVVPRQSPYRAPINHLWPTYDKFVSNVRSLYYNFTTPNQPITPLLGFAELLSDTCNYLWEKNEPRGAMEMLRVAEDICHEVLDPSDPNPVLSGLLAVVASFELNAGPDSRESCLDHMKRVLDLRSRYMNDLGDRAQMQDGLLLGSGYNNLAWAYMTMDGFQKAETLLRTSLEVKQAWATEETAVFPFAECYKNLAHVELSRGNSDKAIPLMTKARHMMKEWRGPDAGATMLFSFILGNMLFCVGEVKKAFIEHMGTLKLRREKLSSTDPYVLDSYHAVGVLYHELGELEAAEYHLNQALEERLSWYPMNEARSLYRLSLVQKDQGKQDLAQSNYAKAKQLRDGLKTAKENDWGFDLGTEEGEIACFDYLVPLASGRMYGVMNMWSKGSVHTRPKI
ncbi:hypothetical protein CDV31_005183 [Fusarium ambrosium]|uniref:Uncharacterized protein n=1 Tax=Fusarium ambrosium TaxID=131363 RepID=A0A428ULL6_9HYPO|nr:hypothetical protein CDV31_005183 [Fusarium ambrosium]